MPRRDAAVRRWRRVGSTPSGARSRARGASDPAFCAPVRHRRRSRAEQRGSPPSTQPRAGASEFRVLCVRAAASLSRRTSSRGSPRAALHTGVHGVDCSSAPCLSLRRSARPAAEFKPDCRYSARHAPPPAAMGSVAGLAITPPATATSGIEQPVGTVCGIVTLIWSTPGKPDEP